MAGRKQAPTQASVPVRTVWPSGRPGPVWSLKGEREQDGTITLSNGMRVRP